MVHVVAASLVGVLLCFGCGTLDAADSLTDPGSARDPSAEDSENSVTNGTDPGAQDSRAQDGNGTGSAAAGVDSIAANAGSENSPVSAGSGELPSPDDDDPDDLGPGGEVLAPTLPSDLNDFTRLTRAEYRATVEAAFGVSPDIHSLPEDGRVGSFTSNVSVTPDPVHPYLLAAEALASGILASGYPECDRDAAQACLEDGYSEAAARLYRRPVSFAEVTGWADVLESVLDAGGSAEQGTRAVLSSILLSPDFLYRSAPAMTADEAGRRTAERLSYTLWDAPPDADLLDVADGSVSAASFAEQAARLSSDERAVAILARFIAQWLHVDTDLRLEEDGFADAPAYRELLAIVRHALSEGTPVSDFVAGRLGAVHTNNAEFYDLGSVSPDADGDVAFVTWDSDDPRRGLLAQDLFISSTRHPDTSRREIFRGLLVRRELLCDAIPAPSADLVALAGEVGERTEDMRCAGCHQLIDPVGEAFAVLDDDLDEPAPMAEVRAHEELEGSYDSLAQLLEAVGQSRAFADCFSRHWLSFFLERPETQLDSAWLQELSDSVHAGASLRDVVEQSASRLFTQTQEMTPWCSGQ